MNPINVDITDNNCLLVEFANGSAVLLYPDGKAEYIQRGRATSGTVVGNLESIVWASILYTYPDETQAVLKAVRKHPVGRKWKKQCWDHYQQNVLGEV
jgi:hypothetical protein